MPEAETLRAIGGLVLSVSLGAERIDAIVVGFRAWLRGYSPGADHGYGHTRLVTAPPSRRSGRSRRPAPRSPRKSSPSTDDEPRAVQLPRHDAGSPPPEAYVVARVLTTQAVAAYRFERDDPDALFVAPDNGQSDRAGLLAGERLALQLQQMESAYFRGNTRRYEATQSFSLALVSPQALLELRHTGTCEFALPEILFDLAYPGQYRRLIKTVRVTIPCVAGPYTNVSAKLTLTQSHVRSNPTADPADLLLLPVQTTPSIATSTAQNDGGLFELSFRDERYFPFEGAGAVSTWRLELPSKLRLFDYGRYRTIFRVDGRAVWIVRVVHGSQLLDAAVLEK